MTTQTIGDMIIAWQDDKRCQVYTKEYANGKASLYTIDGATIEAVVLPTNHNFVILRTAQQTYVRDLNNQPLQEAIHWADYYLEPYTQHFYRKDERGNWYDIEGYRLDAPIFLKGEVLCSLIGKVLSLIHISEPTRPY